jgi:hypothetical protein
MNRRVIGMCVAATFSSLALAGKPVETGGVFTDVSFGDVAKLGSAKRAVLANCVVEYQTSAYVEDDGSWTNRNQTRASNYLVNVPKATLQAVTNASCANLRKELSAAGYEVVSDAELKANASYQQLQTLSGAPAVIGMKTQNGGALLFADDALPLYMPTGAEWGANYMAAVFAEEHKFEQALASVNPGLGGFKLSRNYDVPKLEVELAKSLNAIVVKSWMVIGFGGASASSKRDWGGTSTSLHWSATQGQTQVTHIPIEYKGSGTALLSVRDNQTHISVRLPDGSPKQNVQRDSGPKVTPRDGDVVVTLAGPINAGNEFFTVEDGAELKSSGGGVATAAKVLGGLGGLMGGKGNQKGGKSFYFNTRISDEEAYKNSTSKAIELAQHGLVARLTGK